MLPLDQLLHMGVCRWIARLLIVLMTLQGMPLGRVAAASGATLYVSNTSPTCQGHAPCFSTIQAAINAAQPGDTVQIQAGVYTEQLTIANKNNIASATENSRIVIEADPAALTDSVTLRGVPAPSCTKGFAIKIQKSKFVTVRGLTLTDAKGSAITILGGANKNQAIRLERNRIFRNGSSSCDGGIVVDAGNHDTLIVNNVIYGNNRNGLSFTGSSGDHDVVENTIHNNGWNGVNVARGQDVLLVNNVITRNGTASGSSGGRAGVRYSPSTAQAKKLQLLRNVLCGNVGKELDGPILDGTDTGNRTPTGSEGPGVVSSPGCENPSVIYANVNGGDGTPSTADDDFSLTSPLPSAQSPTIDKGTDPRTLGLAAPNTILEADFSKEAARPQDGDNDSSAAFDIGAMEKLPPTPDNQPPDAVDDTATTAASVAVAIVVLANDTDPNGDSLTVTSVTQGTQGTVALANNVATYTPATGFTGSDTFTYTISDGRGGSDTATVTVSVSAAVFTLTAAPPTANVLRGQSASYTIKIDSTTGFAQLASLSVSGLPSGVSGAFKPPQFAVGQMAILTVSAPSNQPLVTTSFNVSASATVNGGNVTKSLPLSLTVLPVTTSFAGRAVVADTSETPLAGVTITFLGKDDNGNPTGCTGQTVADAAGNFMFTNLPAACTGRQLVRYDGLTATSPLGDYAGVDLVYDIVAGQVTVSPVLVHLPRIDDKETVMVQQNAPTDQTFHFQSIPGLSLTVYAGTTFKLVNGSQPNPFPLTAVQVPVDRLPDAKPPNPQMMMVFIVAFQPANAEASQPVAVYYPNTINTPPGTNMVLMTLDPTKGTMVPYGTGTVSTNGAQVIPDLDPAHPGHRFGLVHFDWHGQMPPPPPGTNPVPPDEGNGGPPNGAPDNKGAFPDGQGNPNGGGGSNPEPGNGGGECNTCPCPPEDDSPPGSPPGAGDPIDIGSGLHVMNAMDMVLNGVRGSVFIRRIYRTLSNVPGPFGIGTSHNYGYRLDTNNPQGSAIINLIMPDGNRFPFVTGIVAGLVITTVPALRGAKMTVLSGNKVDLQWKNGVIFHFVPSSLQLGSVLESITDPNGNKISLVRDGSRPARITQVVDPVGRKLLLNYDANDRVTSITDPLNRTVQYTYNVQGALATVTDPEGGVTRYDYDAPDRLRQITDAKGAVTQNIFDANGRVVEQVQADGGRWRFAYTLFNPLAPTSAVLKTVVTNPLNQETTYRFNAQGFLTDVTDTLGQTRLFEREPGANLLLSVQGAAVCRVCGSPAAGDVNSTYDANGNVLTVTDTLGRTTTFTYEPVFNRITSFVNPNPGVNGSVSFEYDSRGNLTKVVDGNGHETRLTYNAFGLVTQITDHLNHSLNVTYDSVGNPVTITDPFSKTTTLQYDAASRLVKLANRLGRTSMIEYNKLDRVKKSTDAKGNQTSFAYDQVSNLLSLTDARGNATSFVYDPMNRLKTRTDPLLRTDTRTYDVNGNLIQFVDRRGKTGMFTYDALDRLTRETYQDSTVDRVYDARSRLVRAEDAVGGVSTFTYDAAGRELGTTSPNGIVQYVRDELGRVKERKVVGQDPVTYAYDKVGNLLTAASALASATFAYDERNLLTTLTRSNGVSTTYSYDVLGRVLSLVHAKGATTLNSQTYTYDAGGNRSTYTTNLAQVFTTQAVSNISYDAANRIQQRGATNYIHDENGNRKSEVGPAGTTTYNWDARGRLQSIATPDGKTTIFHYDFADNLIAKETTGLGGNIETYVLDDLTNIVSQSNSSGQQLSILTGQAIDSHLATVQPGGQATFGLEDTLNSTVATADQNGAANGQFSYEPFGETTSSGNDYPFHFTGRVPVAGGLYHYRARFYDPKVGRFVSEDPIGFEGNDVNLYRYAYNNPLKYRDPNGQWIIETIGVLIVITAAVSIANDYILNLPSLFGPKGCEKARDIPVDLFSTGAMAPFPADKIITNRIKNSQEYKRYNRNPASPSNTRPPCNPPHCYSGE
jgi:RHS repeat-associated protein